MKGLLLPQILSASKLEDQAPKENESILEENSDSGVNKWLLMHYKVSKEDPHGGNEGAKGQHEANEKPNAGSCLSHASFAVAVSSNLAI